VAESGRGYRAAAAEAPAHRTRRHGLRVRFCSARPTGVFFRPSFGAGGAHDRTDTEVRTTAMAAPELTSLRSPRVVAARRLAKRAFRGKERRFLAEGPQAVREAADHLVEVYATREAAERHPDVLA